MALEAGCGLPLSAAGPGGGGARGATQDAPPVPGLWPPAAEQCGPAASPGSPPPTSVADHSWLTKSSASVNLEHYNTKKMRNLRIKSYEYTYCGSF